MDDKSINEHVVKLLLADHKRDRRWRNIRFFITLTLATLFFIYALFPNWLDFTVTKRDKPYVALVRLTGMIAPEQDFSAEAAIPLLVSAFEDKDAKAVVLDINSGGGTVVQSAIIYDRLMMLKVQYPNKPLIVIGEDMLASGAYLVALAADKIYVNANTFTGSIGVVSKGFGFTTAMQKVGVSRRTFTAGVNKDRFDPFEPLTEGDMTKIKGLLTQTHQYFIGLVKKSRGAKLKGNSQQLFSGDFWRGEEALKLGLVDGLGNVADVLQREFNVDYYRDYSVEPSFVQQVVRNMGVQMNAFLTPTLLYAGV